jgi:SecD/SecF fusion protein
VADSAAVAIIAALLAIAAYIALRFQWKYAVPVMIALMHDLLITAGVYALTGRQVTADTVAALLTILGYSMYDTIIVFDRVRENVAKMQNAAFSQIVNRSMSEVLTRSLATSLCTLLPILALLLFGGSTLKDFAFAMLVGVASGAYSSIFIASPVLTHWKEREPVYRRRRARIAAEHGGMSCRRMRPRRGGARVDVEPRRPRAQRPDGAGAPGRSRAPSEFPRARARPARRARAAARSLSRARAGARAGARPDRRRAARGRRDAPDDAAARPRGRRSRATGRRGRPR